MAESEHPSSTASKFELMVQSVTDYAIFMLDPQGRVTSWNAGARRFKGYEPDEIIGQHFSRFYTRKSASSRSPGSRSKLLIARVASRPKAGGCARMAAASGRTWSSIPSGTLRASSLGSQRSRAI